MNEWLWGTVDQERSDWDLTTGPSSRMPFWVFLHLFTLSLELSHVSMATYYGTSIGDMVDEGFSGCCVNSPQLHMKCTKNKMGHKGHFKRYISSRQI